MNLPLTATYSKWFVIAIFLLIAYALVGMVSPFRGALAWSICAAILLTPAQAWLVRHLHVHANRAAGILTGLVPVVVLILSLTLGLAFFDQAKAISRLLAEQPIQLNSSLLAQLESIPLIGSAVEFFRVYLSATTPQLQAWLDKTLSFVAVYLAGTGGGLLIETANIAIHFFLMLFLLFFFLRDGRTYLSYISRWVPVSKVEFNSTAKLIGDTVQAVFYGEILTALAQGILVGVGFQIAGIPSALVFGAITVVFALLPVGGTAIVWVPATGYLLFTDQTGAAIFLLIWGAGVSVADNLMRPYLVSRLMPISVAIVFAGMIGGVAAFGMIGVIIGPVILNLVQRLASHFTTTVRNDTIDL